MARCEFTSSLAKRTKAREKKKSVNVMESEDSDSDISYILDLDITGEGSDSNHLEQDNNRSNTDVSGVPEFTLNSLTADNLQAIKREDDNCGEDSGMLNSVSKSVTESSSLSRNSSQPAGFLVVIFVDEKTMAVVPRSWVKDELCSWPPIIAPQNIKQRVLRCESPKSSWQKIQIRILDSADSYTKGCKKLKQAERTVSLIFGDSEIPDLNRKNKRKSGSSVDSSSPPSKRPNGQTAMPQSSVSPLESLISAQVPENHPPSSPYLSESSISSSIAGSMSALLPLMLQICNHLPKSGNTVESAINEDFQKKVLQNLEEIRSEIRELQQILNSKVSAKMPDECPPLPLQQVEEMNQFESFIDNEDNFTSVCNVLSKKGGNSVKDLTRRILMSLVSNKLSIKYNWKGIGGRKLAFSSLIHTNKLIIDAVQHHRGYECSTDDEIQACIKKWLLHAKDRDGGRKMRQKLTNINNVVTPCTHQVDITENNIRDISNISNSENIPLQKFPAKVVKKMENKERPTISERQNVVRILAHHIMETIPTPRKRHIEPVAIALAKKYPNSFKDVLCDSNSGLQHGSLLQQLTSMVENEQHAKRGTI